MLAGQTHQQCCDFGLVYQPQSIERHSNLNWNCTFVCKVQAASDAPANHGHKGRQIQFHTSTKQSRAHCD
uniref:Uncharacterized protein n=1 Tax=Anopheles minimus TaxID=112268 RepID=A0A182W610_9DIPT